MTHLGDLCLLWDICLELAVTFQPALKPQSTEILWDKRLELGEGGRAGCFVDKLVEGDLFGQRGLRYQLQSYEAAVVLSSL